MGETFPEGTSQSDPSIVPPRIRDEDELIEDNREQTSDEPIVEEEPENQQTG